MPDSEQRPPLTIEDLLRFKRAERPSAEFWSRFETDLRQKQLAALIERRPWWQTLPHTFSSRRAFIPLGATAILALTLVTAKLYVPSQLTRVEPANADQLVVPVQLASVPAAAPALNQLESMGSAVYGGNHDAYALAAEIAVAPLSEHLPEHAAELTPWSAPIPVQSPSAKLFAANLERQERFEPRLTQALSSNPVPVTTSRIQRSGGAVAELASVSALSSKRTRLLAQFNDRQFTPEPQAPAVVRERLTRRLANTDTNYSEHFTRVGLKGDQVSLRF